LIVSPSFIVVLPHLSEASQWRFWKIGAWYSTVRIMPRNQILHFSDSKRGGCGATVRLETGEPCWLSIAQSGVLVKKSRFGLLGAVLYSEKDTYRIALGGIALAYLFPEKRFPDGISSPHLRSFLNAILHCRSAAEVCQTLNEAVEAAEKRAGRPLKQVSRYDFPSWAVPPPHPDGERQ
jgi:hypothetical protein